LQFRILNVKTLDALAVNLDELQVIQN